MAGGPRLGAGDLREVVTIKTVAGSKTGDTFTTVRTQRCMIEPAGGMAIQIGQARGVEIKLKITFREKPLVTTDQLIVTSDGTIYEIDGKQPHLRDRQEVFCNVRKP